MPLIPAGRAVFGILAAILVAAPALAHGPAGRELGYRRPPPPPVAARALPPEIRYRDPRYVPPPRRAPRLGPPAHLIEAYLPRTTDVPLYNEPPSRFPTR